MPPAAERAWGWPVGQLVWASGLAGRQGLLPSAPPPGMEKPQARLVARGCSKAALLPRDTSLQQVGSASPQVLWPQGETERQDAARCVLRRRRCRHLRGLSCAVLCCLALPCSLAPLPHPSASSRFRATEYGHAVTEPGFCRRLPRRFSHVESRTSRIVPARSRLRGACPIPGCRAGSILVSPHTTPPSQPLVTLLSSCFIPIPARTAARVSTPPFLRPLLAAFGSACVRGAMRLLAPDFFFLPLPFLRHSWPQGAATRSCVF